MSNGKHVSNFANLNMIIIQCHVKKTKRFYERLSFKVKKKIEIIFNVKSHSHTYI